MNKIQIGIFLKVIILETKVIFKSIFKIKHTLLHKWFYFGIIRSQQCSKDGQWITNSWLNKPRVSQVVHYWVWSYDSIKNRKELRYNILDYVPNTIKL